MLARLENILWGLSAAAIIALGLLIGANVFLREVFGSQVPDSVTIVRELMVAAILLPLAAATAARSHVAVEFISNRFNAKVRSWCIVFGSIVGLMALTPLLFAGWRELSSTWQSGSFFYGDLNLPRWPGRALFLLGIGVCFLRLSELVIRDTLTLLRGGIIDVTRNQTEAE
ncbi:TRAP transporter small permease [Parasulfitobacter algicola]|uniref:TRAP transporter small permease protein n=1 Tax=Parasulfitobacter algicola TaxID=2614809 RepID=A0ABX2IQ68_9RHOB|nr:TRAP transporter small permease [Sulfitobacter algicola]NSX54993.1 TRAP transporter small permease [Sulfitobacter algicola]